MSFVLSRLRFFASFLIEGRLRAYLKRELLDSFLGRGPGRLRRSRPTLRLGFWLLAAGMGQAAAWGDAAEWVAPEMGEAELLEDAAFAKAYGELREAGLDSPEEVFRLGQFYQANAFLEEAATCYRQVAGASAGELAARARYHLAAVEEARGNFAEAEDILQRLREEGVETPMGLLRMADLRAANGGDAEALYEACLSREASFAGASIALAKRAMRGGDMEAAKRRLRECLRREPECGDAALLLANIYAADGEQALAERFLEIGQANPRHTADRDPWLEALQEYRFGEYRLACDADELFTALRFEEARAVFERGLKLYPKSGDLWLGLAKLEFASDRRREAFAALQRAVSSPDASGQAYFIFADERYRDGDRQGALEICDAARGAGLLTARTALLEARCWRELGDLEATRDALDRGLADFRYDSDLLEASGDLAREEGRAELALRHYESALQMRPMAAALYAKLLATAIAERAWLAAERSLELLAARMPQEGSLRRLKSQYWLARALEFEESEEREAWLAALRSAYESDAASEPLFRQVASRLAGNGEWLELSQLASDARAHLSDSLHVYKMEGVALLQLGRIEEGIGSLRQARAKASASGDWEEAQRLAAMIAKLAGKAGSV
ncbi:tetratricopeptide repeat protein [Pelagicoccus enzymogenes]|uniref:tetratricopeptide repeat protein n=1 Tax=Pelagicoccus enzymogenes TaxID=2773457 RepID=UPI0028103E7C|nr:tetratricopeptide repeat protein [Pelagicoccus enzymogenes]MDQ8197074.1 tetratricopeptide repeat protein [Pelagicoccus enzymogenes]